MNSVKGGFGARPVKDGINAVASTISNMMNTPIEILEMSFPLRVEEYALVPDSGGAGNFRGGLGVRRVWRVLERDAHAAVCCERTVTPPFGLAGGSAGAPAKLTLQLPGGTARKLTSKGGFTAPAGSLLVVEAPGSGGYGPPAAEIRRASPRIWRTAMCPPQPRPGTTLPATDFRQVPSAYPKRNYQTPTAMGEAGVELHHGQTLA